MQAAIQAYEGAEVLYTAMELSNRYWKLGFSNGEKIRRKTVDARDCEAMLREIGLAKAKLGVSAAARVVICFEAGRDGHWIHRWLTAEGFEVMEIDSSSIETARGRKHVKTDRLDVVKLLDLLMRYCLGFRQSFRVVRVPSEAAEAAQRLHREDAYLVSERNRVTNRMLSLLATQGLVKVPLKRGFERWLEDVRLWHGEGLSVELKTEVLRLYAQYRLLVEQLEAVAAAYAAEKRSESPVGIQRRQLELLKAVGPKISRVLSAEAFAWRKFDNTKQVGAMGGLTPTAQRSGETAREGGIGKSGNHRVRWASIELGWLWLRWQPDSALSRWFNRRFAQGGKRMRRIGIVALARKLLIALWKYLEHGIVPEGAVLTRA